MHSYDHATSHHARLFCDACSDDGAAHCDGTSTIGEDCSHVRGDNNWNDAGCGGNRAAICGSNPAWIGGTGR